MCPVNLAYPGTLQEAEVFVEEDIDCETQLNTYINEKNSLAKQTNKIYSKNMICARNSDGVTAKYCVRWLLLHTDHVCQDSLYLYTSNTFFNFSVFCLMFVSMKKLNRWLKTQPLLVCRGILEVQWWVNTVQHGFSLASTAGVLNVVQAHPVFTPASHIMWIGLKKLSVPIQARTSHNSLT